MANCVGKGGDFTVEAVRYQVSTGRPSSLLGSQMSYFLVWYNNKSDVLINFCVRLRRIPDLFDL